MPDQPRIIVDQDGLIKQERVEHIWGNVLGHNNDNWNIGPLCLGLGQKTSLKEPRDANFYLSAEMPRLFCLKCLGSLDPKIATFKGFA